MSKLLGIFTSEHYRAAVTLDEIDGQEEVHFRADMDIDCDGSGGNPHHDPYFQPDTTLHHDGKALNAETVPFIVVPPIVCQQTRGKVLGCRAKVRNLRTGITAEAVVGDIGPRSKVGEGSPALATMLGINPNPNTGGEDDPVIDYWIYPGVPAVVAGVTYNPQSYGA